MPDKTERYSCQIKLPGFGIDAQRKLKQAKVLIVGAGGLGCPAAQYLVAAGFGTVALVDDDSISKKNLHRQILFNAADEGLLKVTTAVKRLRPQNPDVRVIGLPIRLTAGNIRRTLAPYDIVLDCSDNFQTRYLLNDACVLAGKPLVYGAAYQYEGQVAVWNLPLAGGTRSANYRDAFPVVGSGFSPNCDTGGVLPTLTGVIGCLQAAETIKYVAGLPGLLTSRLFIIDSQTMQSRTVGLPARTRVVVKRLPRLAEAKVPTLTIREFRQQLADQKFRLIDVRTAEEHAAFNIGGDNLPLDQLLAGRTTADLTKPLVFYCRSGARSATAVRYVLEKTPTASVWSLAGGVQAWQATAG